MMVPDAPGSTLGPLPQGLRSAGQSLANAVLALAPNQRPRQGSGPTPGGKDAALRGVPDLSRLRHRYSRPCDAQGEGAVTPDDVERLARHLVQTDARFSPRSYAHGHDPIAGTELERLRQAGPGGDCGWPYEERDLAIDRIRQAMGPHDVKGLNHGLVALMNRPVDTVTVRDRGGEVVEAYSQRPGSLTQSSDGVYSVQEGKTPDSVAAKQDRDEGNEHMLQHPANMAVVVTRGGEVAASRSARTDTAKKLEQLLTYHAAFDALAQSNARADEPFVARRVAVISAMDNNVAKTMLTRLVRGEDESVFIQGLRQAMDELFPGTTEFRSVRVMVQGEPREIRLQRPLLINVTLSGWSLLPQAIDGYREANTRAAASLFDEVARRWQLSSNDSFAPKLAEPMLACRTVEDKKRLLRDPNYTWMGGCLSAQNKLALQALKVTLGESNLNHVPMRGAQDPGTELLYWLNLLNVCGLTCSLQCKSGLDRTLTALSLKLAADAFARRKGKPFDPDSASDSDRGRFCKLFSVFADTFGKSMFMAVRGNLHPKWSTHPVPNAYYIPPEER